VLRAIDEPTVNLVIWRRRLPPGLAPALTAWAQRPRPTVEAVLDPARFDLAPAVETIDDRYWRAWLLADFRVVTAGFLAIARPRRLKLSFGPVVTAQCAKFHVDWMRYRLVTTYAGPGTEWLANDQVRREVLDAPPADHVQSNRQVQRSVAPIRRAATGDVVLMKGELHGSAARGAVHRSPPVDDPSQARVVLVLSAADAAP